MLLTDEAESPPEALQGFLLDTKPGYVDDPTRAVYNHVWLIGDQRAISVPFQAEVDRITQLAKVRDGSGATPDLGTTDAGAEPEPEVDLDPDAGTGSGRDK